MRPQGPSRSALLAAALTAAPTGAFVVAPPSGAGIEAVVHAGSLGDGSALLHHVRYDRR